MHSESVFISDLIMTLNTIYILYCIYVFVLRHNSNLATGGHTPVYFLCRSQAWVNRDGCVRKGIRR